MATSKTRSWKDNFNIDLKEDRLCGWDVNGTGSELCPVAGFCISNVEPSDSATRDLYSWGYEDRCKDYVTEGNLTSWMSTVKGRACIMQSVSWNFSC